MRERNERIFLLTFFFGVLLTISGFMYAKQIETTAYETQLQSKDVLLETATYKTNQLEKKITQAEQDLAKRQKELDDATQSLAAKVKELESAQKKITDQQSQISANSAELSKLRTRPPLFSFTVTSSTLQNVEQKKEDVKALVTAAYDEIIAVYSQPYLLHEVTIAFVDTFTNPAASAEISIANSKDGLSITIKIKDFDKNSFSDINAMVHEIIHSFHGLAVTELVAHEEGITVAATDAVMARLIAAGKIPSFNPLYIRISANDYATTSLTLPRDTATFYTSSNVGNYYQIAGYGWYEIYKADATFFKTFNEKIYAQKRNGEEITEELVNQTIRESVTTKIQGKSIDAWLTTKAFAFN